MRTNEVTIDLFGDEVTIVYYYQPAEYEGIHLFVPESVEIDQIIYNDERDEKYQGDFSDVGFMKLVEKLTIDKHRIDVEKQKKEYAEGKC